MVYLGIFFLNYVLVNHLSIRTVPHNSTFVIAKTSVSNYTQTHKNLPFSHDYEWSELQAPQAEIFSKWHFVAFGLGSKTILEGTSNSLYQTTQPMPRRCLLRSALHGGAPNGHLPFCLSCLSLLPPQVLNWLDTSHLTSPPCLCVNTERFCRFCGCLSFFPHTHFTFLEEGVWLSRDISWLPARWRGGAPSHPHLPVSWQAGRRCWPPPREAGRARWGGKGDAAPAHGACGHQESPARGAGASPTFARPSLWGQLLSPHLGATQVTGTQPHLCCCCFIHLLSSAVLQKLLPNYAPFFFFLPPLLISFLGWIASQITLHPLTHMHAHTLYRKCLLMRGQ